MFQENVHAFPQRVVKDLNHFLMNERIRGESFDRIAMFDAMFNSGKSKRQRISRPRKLERRSNLLVSARRPESHHDVFGMKNGFEPRPKQHRNIERRQRALSDNYGMNKLDRDMLRVGCVGTASEGEQAPSLDKALGHGAASFRQ